MNGIKIADIIFAGIIIVLLSLLIYCAIKNTNKEESLSVPSGYHIIYDNCGDMLIVPKDYHFHCDKKGNLTLVR